MPFDIKNSNQCMDYNHTLQNSMYGYLAQTNTQWIRPIGIPLGIICPFMDTTARVAVIGESIVKGLIHIVGSIACIDGCSFDSGIKNLTIRIAFKSIELVVQVLFCNIITCTMNICGFALKPQDFATDYQEHIKNGFEQIEFDPKGKFEAKFDLQNSHQIKNYIKENLKIPMYTYLKKCDGVWMHAAGLPVGLASCFLDVVGQISLIVEPFFKGLINIGGYAFSDKCSLIKGVNQIFIHTYIKVGVIRIIILASLVLGLEIPLTLLALRAIPTNLVLFALKGKKGAEEAEEALNMNFDSKQIIEGKEHYKFLQNWV